MADRTSARILIGGPIPASLVTDLCEAIYCQAVSLDWGDGQFAPRTADELLAACSEHGGVDVLQLCDLETRDGCFEDLEDFLKEHDMAFNRFSESMYGYDPEVTMFRRGCELFETVTNTAGEPVIRASCLEAPVVALAEAISRLPDRPRQGMAVLKDVLQELRKLLPPRLPPLATFEIEDGK